MKTLQNTSYSIFLLIGIALVLYFYAFSTPKQAHATINESVSSMTSSSTLCASNTSTLLIATSSSGRNLAFISNDGATAVFLGFGVPAVNYKGYLLSASSTLRFDSVGSFSGAIYCSGLGANASTSIEDSNN